MKQVNKQCFLLSLILFVQLVVAQTSIPVANDSFESNTDWSNLSTSNDGYYSPVDGNSYSLQNGGSAWTSQMTNEIVTAGTIYTLTIYARSANLAGQTDPTVVQIELFDGMNDIYGNFSNVQIPHLQGAPATYANDDGANIWIDGSYRMQFNEQIFYQNITENPITSPWTQLTDADYDVNFALGQIHLPSGFKALFGTDYNDVPPMQESTIFLHPAVGNAPDYTWQPEQVILTHFGDQTPWVIDAHAYYDDQTGRLWMSWGGHKFWVSELDPATGLLLSNPSNKEFDTHPLGTHTQIAEFVVADAWSDGYHEGPALFKKDGYWYCFGSYGNFATNYTIRYGRATSPQGPYYDRNGVNMNNNGATLLFGDEGEQLVPGHPHIWEENGQYYIGYDYRKNNTGTSPTFDYMGIRKLYWVDGWPTIYQPVTVTIDADNYPQFIGQPLGIRFRNVGGAGSRLAIDKVTLTKTSGSGNITLNDLFATPTTAEKTMVLNDWNTRDVDCYNWTIHHSATISGLPVDIVSHDTYGLSNHTHYGAVRYPQNYNPSQNYPVLVYNHGGQSGVNVGVLNSLNGCYEDFFIIIPSFRGEDLRTGSLGFGDFLSEAANSEFDGDIDDALALMNCVLLNVSGASSQNITVMGGSRGGGVSYLMSIRDSRITRVSNYFGATDHLTHPGYQQRIETYLNTGMGQLNPPLNTILNVAQPYVDGLISLQDARSELLRRSVIHFDDLLPELIEVHHGAMDFVVEVEHSQLLEQKMNANGIVAPYFTYYEYANGDHGSNIDPMDLRRTFICNMDFDNDGSLLVDDCNNIDAAINPNQMEIPMNGIDDDCDPSTLDSTTPPITLQIKVLLEGAYLGNGEMNTALFDDNILSNSQPYNSLPWQYTGTENTSSSALFDITDWVLVELLDVNYNWLASRAVLVDKLGNLVETNGTMGVQFNGFSSANTYHVLIRHRNHLDVVSNTPLSVNNTMPHDFTNPTMVLGSTSQMNDLGGGVYGLCVGDFDASGIISVADFNGYTTHFSAIDQYIPADFDLDKNVTVSDFNKYVPNASKIGVLRVRY